MKKLKHKNSNFTLTVGFHSVYIDKNGECVVPDEEALDLLRLDGRFESMVDYKETKKKVQEDLDGFEPIETD